MTELDRLAQSGDLRQSARPVLDWLLGEGRKLTGNSEKFLAGFCQRLLDHGLPLERVNLHLKQLHPQFSSRSLLWRAADGGTVARDRAHGIENTDQFRRSPVRPIFEGGPAIRLRVGSAKVADDYPIVEDLKRDGYTDYAILPLRYSGRTTMAISLSTRQPGGFAERDISAFESLLPAFAALIELIETRRTARLLLDTYVGQDAGSQVLSGDIQRGQGRAIEAVVWFSDIRGFSQLSNSLPPGEVIELLNAYFDVMAEPIKAQGGEILKFLGDGLLAIFPVETISAQTCQNAGAGALAAAEAALVGLDALNTTRRAVGQAEIQTGIALHIGEMMYGNVGSADRLDFTVIGSAVNLVVRLEGLTRGLEPPIVCSAELAELCGRPLQSLGLHELKGFAEPQEAFTPGG